MHHAEGFCRSGLRSRADDPFFWIGVVQLAVQRVWDWSACRRLVGLAAPTAHGPDGIRPSGRGRLASNLHVRVQDQDATWTRADRSPSMMFRSPLAKETKLDYALTYLSHGERRWRH